MNFNKAGMRKFLWSSLEVLETAAIAFIAVYLVRSYVAQPFLVSGSSMEPTFSDGNYLLVDELSYHFREPERGEVIIFHPPVNPKSYYIKRMIGLPGEKVVINVGTVSVYEPNGSKLVLQEPYTAEKAATDHFEIILKAD